MKIISLCKHVAKITLGKEKIKFIPTSDEKLFSNVFYENIDEAKLVSKNQNYFKQLAAIDGVGFSGSSAVGDFLGEFDNCTSLGGVDMRENPDRGAENSYEIDFLRDPGSLIDLEKICYSNIHRLKNDAIHRFIKVCKEYYENDIPIFDEYFYEHSKSFLKNIISYSFRDAPENITYYPKKLTVQQYRSYAKEFMSAFLQNIPSKDFLICDNLASVGRPDTGFIKDYLGDCKVLFNYCDPRDVYARARLQPGNDWVPVDPEIFVKNWKEEVAPALNDTDSNMLVTNFDDFCNEYENQAKKIMDFLGLEESNHTNKFKYFNPNISINNTGVWKKLENQKAIEYIFENLKEFCYDKENHQRYIK